MLPCSIITCVGLMCAFSSVTYVGIGVDIARVLVPRILKIAIPIGVAAFVYTYTQKQHPAV